MSGTRALPKVHFQPEGKIGRVQCGELIDDYDRVTSDWPGVPDRAKCIRCVKSLARSSAVARLERIISEAERNPGGSVPSEVILAIGKAG